MKLAVSFVFTVVVLALVFHAGAPRCDANSPHGLRLGGILMGGCP